ACRRSRWRFRRRVRGFRSHRDARDGYRRNSRLLETDVNAAARVFEFLEAVLIHEGQKAFDVGQVDSTDVCTAAGFGLWFFRHLEFEKVPGRGGQIDRSLFGDNDVVFDADAAEAFDVDARLDGNDHAFLEDGLLVLAQPGHLVDF